LFHDLVPAATLLAPAQHWCRELDHPAYDCLNLALAERRSAVMLTQGQRLLRKVQEVPQASGLAMALDSLELSSQEGWSFQEHQPDRPHHRLTSGGIESGSLLLQKALQVSPEPWVREE
jgi:hypothetical protein